MNTPMHKLIAEAAVSTLEGECAKFWDPLRGAMAKASNYPDYFAAGEIKADQHAQIDGDWREYTMIPSDGGTVAHSLITPLELRINYPPLIQYWNEAVVGNIKSGGLEKAAKFAGCLSHLIGDTGQAAHVLDERNFKYLFPQGENCFVIHSTIESVSGQIDQLVYHPRILARSLEELNWRLIEELEILKRWNMAEVVPMMQAILMQDYAKAETSASRTLVVCVQLFADLLFTLWNLAFDQIKHYNDRLELASLIPVEEHCDMLFNYGIMRDRIPSKKINEPLALDLGHGDVPGIALLADMSQSHKTVRESSVDYSIPRGVFKYLSAQIGLNRNSVNETKAIFKIKLDGEIVFTSNALGVEDSAVELKIKLKDAERIQLYVRDARPAPCDTKFFYPVFANPVLAERT